MLHRFRPVASAPGVLPATDSFVIGPGMDGPGVLIGRVRSGERMFGRWFGRNDDPSVPPDPVLAPVRTKPGAGDRVRRPERASRDSPVDCLPHLAAEREVRVRTFELRLIGLAVATCWVVAATYVLIGYRPGGPIDVGVGLVALLPAAVALAGVAWPPVARGDRGFSAMLWLAAASLLLLVPSIADVSGQLGGGGTQTLLPSAESAYPWVLALIGTSLFAGFGIARKRLGQDAMRRRRVMRGIVIAGVLAAASAVLFAAVAFANELALRDRFAATSRFGPTDPSADPPTCNGPIGIGHNAQVVMHLDGTMDGRPLGSVDVSGERSSA